MKKIFVPGFIILSFAPSFAAASAAAEIRWAEVYKAGPVKLVPDPGFGKGEDWGSFLFESSKDIAVAADGSIFMANSREHTIHQFDPSGKKVLTFGRKGQGPGDLETPGSPSILDEKYLVVSEYALNRRISLFDLNGRFFKLFTAQRPVYDVVALTGTKIAYLAKQFEQESKDRNPGVRSMPMTIRVVLKDIETGAENVVLSRTVTQKMIMLSSGGSMSFGDNMVGDILLARTNDGNLAVGDTNSPQIVVYGIDGKVLRSFELKKPPRRVTPEYLDRYKTVKLAPMLERLKKLPSVKPAYDELARLDYSQLFNENFPYFIEMRTDADGNFLFFQVADDPGKSNLDFSVYSPQGEFLADTRIDPGPFEVNIDYRFRCLSFAKTGLIGLAVLKDDADQMPVLFRVVPGARVR